VYEGVEVTLRKVRNGTEVSVATVLGCAAK